MTRRAPCRRVFLAALVVGLSGLSGNVAAEDGAPHRVVNDRCPVMADEFASPLHEIPFAGVTVRFCCDKCRNQFVAEPLQYVSRLPQLPPEMVQAMISGGQDQGQSARAARWVDRWVGPLFLGMVTLLAGWLIFRIARRPRHNPVEEPRGHPGLSVFTAP